MCGGSALGRCERGAELRRGGGAEERCGRGGGEMWNRGGEEVERRVVGEGRKGLVRPTNERSTEYFGGS